eukprot:scaffold240268_cov15-Tisochrysis_lutea.AAC.1
MEFSVWMTLFRPSSQIIWLKPNQITGSFFKGPVQKQPKHWNLISLPAPRTSLKDFCRSSKLAIAPKKWAKMVN